MAEIRRWRVECEGKEHWVEYAVKGWLANGEVLVDGKVVATWGSSLEGLPKSVEFEIDGKPATLRRTGVLDQHFDLAFEGRLYPEKQGRIFNSLATNGMRKNRTIIVLTALLCVCIVFAAIKITDLQLEAHKLQLELTRKAAELTLMNTNYEQLQESARLMNTKYEQLQEVAEENKFKFYYASLAKRQYGVEALEKSLGRWEWVAGAYREGTFDCSEMAAYLERQLELEGFHTKIAIGNCPFSVGRHAWLLVEAIAGKYMPVEPTTYRMVKWDNPYFNNYFKYERTFESIKEALAYNYENFDWWETR
jgi:cell division protein FtsB